MSYMREHAEPKSTQNMSIKIFIYDYERMVCETVNAESTHTK